MNAVDELIKKALKRADVLLSVISHRDTNIDVMSDCMSLFSSKKHHFTWMPLTNEADISRARSRVATHFLKNTTEDVLMFIDDDIRFKQEDVTKIIDHVVDGKLICGAMYVQKGTIDKTGVMEEGEAILFHKDEKEAKKMMCLPNGFLAIHRKIFEAVLKLKRPDGDPLVPFCNEGAPWAFYPFFDSQPMKLDGKWRFVPEDWSFCLRAREAGFQTWVDPSIMLSHLGEYEYDFRDKIRPPKISWEEFKGVAYK